MAKALTKDTVVNLLSAALGEPQTTNDKIRGWFRGLGFEIVVQMDFPTAPDTVYIWIPAVEGRVTEIDCPCDLYAAGKSRHSAVSRHASLAKNRWALRFRPRNFTDLQALIASIQSWKRARGPTRGGTMGDAGNKATV